MKDKITQFDQGADIPLQYVDITYAGVVPTTLVGLSFYATVEVYSTKQEVINLTNNDINLDDNGGVPIVTFLIPTASLVSGVLYDYDFWVVDPIYGKHTLDRFFLRLGSPVTNSFP